jgi:hypothetical protein
VGDQAGPIRYGPSTPRTPPADRHGQASPRDIRRRIQRQGLAGRDCKGYVPGPDDAGAAGLSDDAAPPPHLASQGRDPPCFPPHDPLGVEGLAIPGWA